jgi:hypothetical protein
MENPRCVLLSQAPSPRGNENIRRRAILALYVILERWLFPVQPSFDLSFLLLLEPVSAKFNIPIEVCTMIEIDQYLFRSETFA